MKITKANFNLPAVGLGTYKLTGDKGKEAIKTAIDLGYTHIDTAQAYNNEEEVGLALNSSGKSSDNILVTTKVANKNFPRMLESVEESLEKLQLQKVNLLLLHWPAATERETLAAVEMLNAVLEKGYTDFVGVSNFNIALLEKAQKLAPIVGNQVEYHTLLSQQKLLLYMREHNLLLTSYSPLAQGKLADHPKLNEIAEKHNKTASQIALRWLIQQDGVVAIPKTSSPKRMKENLEAENFHLSETEMQKIFSLNTKEHLISTSTAPEWD